MARFQKRTMNDAGSSKAVAPQRGSASKHSAPRVKAAKSAMEPAAKRQRLKEIVEPESSEEEEEEEDEEEDEEDVENEEESETEEPATAGEAHRKTFADLGIIESLCEACENLGFKYPTPIQEQSIPLALEGRDM
jgi:ATP-dependent RNA helicase DDX47/RRP3